MAKIIHPHLSKGLKLKNPLTPNNHECTSPADTTYNCFAWAENDCFQRWDCNMNLPRQYNLDYWPRRLERNFEPETIKRLYREFYQFEDCKKDDFDKDFYKIVLYEDPATNEITHAARQLLDGRWASKLGFAQDIIHSLPEDLNGKAYGVATYYLRKRRESDLDMPPPTISRGIPSPKEFEDIIQIECYEDGT